jgi:hypothetical protein
VPETPEVRLVNRVVPAEPPEDPDHKLFAPEGSAEGCASGECLPEPSAPEPPRSAAAPTDLDKWRAAVESLRLENPRHGKSLSFARVVGFTPEGVRVSFPPDAAFHRNSVLGMSRAIVEASLSKIFGKPTKILEEAGATALQSAPQSIAEVEASDRQVRENSIDGKVREHPAVRNVLRFLGGSIEHIQYLEASKPDAVRPVGPSDEES